MSLLSGPAVSEAINDPNNALARLATTDPDDRPSPMNCSSASLNRHATQPETDSTLASWKTIREQDALLSAELAEREAWWAPLHERKQRERQLAIATATAAVAARSLRHRPAGRAAGGGPRRTPSPPPQALATHESDPRTPALPAWEATLGAQRLGHGWVPLEIDQGIVRTIRPS